MHREIHPLRLPRLVTGIMGRSKDVEGLAVHDEVPVGIPHLTPEEAPVIFRTHAGAEHRAWDGLAYEPVGRGSFGDCWDALFGRVERFLLHQIGMGPYVSLDPIQHVTGWDNLLKGASRKRGFGPAEGLHAREIHDEGRVAQAASAVRLADRLAMVGDTLMVRTGLPRLRCRLFDIGGAPAMAAVAEAVLLRWDEGDVGQAFGGEDFRLDRPDEVAAYGAGLAARLGVAIQPIRSGFEVVDGPALAACYDRVAAEADLGLIGVARGVTHAMMQGLAHYPDGMIEGYLDLRRMADRGDGAGIRAWMERLPEIREAAGALPWNGTDNEHHKREAVARIDRALIRHEEVELRKSYGAGDEAALSAFGR